MRVAAATTSSIDPTLYLVLSTFRESSYYSTSLPLQNIPATLTSFVLQMLRTRGFALPTPVLPSYFPFRRHVPP